MDQNSKDMLAALALLDEGGTSTISAFTFFLGTGLGGEALLARRCCGCGYLLIKLSPPDCWPLGMMWWEGCLCPIVSALPSSMITLSSEKV